jgi:hypothetical protein
MEASNIGLVNETGSTDYIGGAYGDPSRLWAHDFAPKNLKQLFKWTEYLYYNSAQIFAGVRKYAEYPITEINYNSPSGPLKVQYKELLEEKIGIKNILIQASIDLQIYGNSFSSISLPFRRYLKCPKCNSTTAISVLEFKFKLKDTKFSAKCPDCEYKGNMEHKDTQVIDPTRVNIIRWDPKDIFLSYNPLTADYEYYLQIPTELVSKVKSGNKHVIGTTPISFLEAIASESHYKFQHGKIFHMKFDAPAGVKKGWGYPPLCAAIPLYHHTMVLRKANEAIALERIIPMRVMSPQATSGAADPITTMSISGFMEDLKQNIEDWRKDPNHIMLSPIAVGVQQVGGEGRALMVDSEIERAENNIIASLGFPKEFVYGGLSFTGSSVTLRMLENQLESSVFQINKYLKWIGREVSIFMGWTEIDLELGNFKMVDDIQQKQLIQQLFQQQLVSKTTLAEAHGIDLVEEQAKIKSEVIADARNQAEIQTEMEKLQKQLSEQAKQMAAQGEQGPPGLNYDQQAVIGQADQVATQFLEMDPSQRRSQLSALQAEDYVMYSVVIQRMEQLKLDQRNQAMQGGM